MCQIRFATVWALDVYLEKPMYQRLGLSSCRPLALSKVNRTRRCLKLRQVARRLPAPNPMGIWAQEPVKGRHFTWKPEHHSVQETLIQIQILSGHFTCLACHHLLSLISGKYPLSCCFVVKGWRQKYETPVALLTTGIGCLGFVMRYDL